MSNIDLNSKEFDGTLIFNDGVAGVVENVRVEVSKKDVGAADNLPEYRLRFINESGAGIDKAFFYLDETTENFDRRLKGLGSELKHIWGTLIGPETKIPGFNTHKEMLDGMLKAFREALADNLDELYRVTVDYGTVDYPQQYMRVQTFPPYIESMHVEKEQSRLGLRRNARTTSFVPDTKEATYDEVHTTTDADASAWK